MRSGIAGLTLLAFLLAPLAWPFSAHALRVQAGLESASESNLEDALRKDASAGLEEPRFIPGARVFTSAPGAPVAVRLEIAPHAFSSGLKESVAHKLLAVASRQDTSFAQESGRSFYIPLGGQEIFQAKGRTFRLIKEKQVTYQGRPPIMEPFSDKDSPILQPMGRLGFDSATGRIRVEPPVVRPTGGGFIEEALNEYEMMLEAFTKGIPTGYPIGIGLFPELSFQGREIGFVLIALEEENDIRYGRVFIEEGEAAYDFRGTLEGNRMVRQAHQQFGVGSRASAETLRRLHEAGIIHTHPSTSQYQILRDGRAAIYDFTNARRAREMSRQEFILRVFNDYKGFYLDAFLTATQGIHLSLFRKALRRLHIQKSSLRELVEGYFTPEDMERIGKQRILNATREEAFESFMLKHWGRKENVDGKRLEDFDHDLVRIFQEIAGPIYDRAVSPPSAGLEERGVLASELLRFYRMVLDGVWPVAAEDYSRGERHVLRYPRGWDYVLGNPDRFSLGSKQPLEILQEPGTGRRVVLVRVEETARVSQDAEAPLPVVSPGHYVCTVCIARGWDPALQKWVILQWHFVPASLSGAPAALQPLQTFLPRLLEGLQEIRILLSPNQDPKWRIEEYPPWSPAAVRQEWNGQLSLPEGAAGILSVTIAPHSFGTGVTTIATEKAAGLFLHGHGYDETTLVHYHAMAAAAAEPDPVNFPVWPWDKMKDESASILRLSTSPHLPEESLQGGQAGLEEMGVLEAAGNPRQILVIEASVVSRRVGLAEFVRRMPRGIGRVMLVGAGSVAAQEAAAANPNVTLVDSDDPADWAVAAAGLEEAERIRFVGEADSAERFAGYVRRIIPAADFIQIAPAAGLEAILRSLGLPDALLDEINAAGLEQTLARAHAA